MEFFFGIFGIGLLLAAVLPIGLVLLVVVVVFSGRDDPDPASRRQEVLYLCAVTFVAAFTLVFATYGVASSLLRLPLEDESSDVFDFTDEESISPDFDENGDVIEPDDEDIVQGEDDDEWRAAIQTGLLALVAAGVLMPHLRRLRSVVDEPTFPATSGRRVYLSYLYATAFTSVAVLLVTVTVAAYSAFSAVAPGLASDSGEGQRSDGVVALGSAMFLIGGAVVVLLLHLREADRWRPRSVTPPSAPPAPEAPPGWGQPPPAT